MRRSGKELALRKDRALLPEVTNVLLRGESAHARQMAAWLLGELSPGTDETLDALHPTIDDPEAAESLRGQAIESLGNQLGGEAYERAADALIALLENPSVEILYNAVFALGTMRCRRARSARDRLKGPAQVQGAGNNRSKRSVRNRVHRFPTARVLKAIAFLL